MNHLPKTYASRTAAVLDPELFSLEAPGGGAMKTITVQVDDVVCELAEAPDGGRAWICASHAAHPSLSAWEIITQPGKAKPEGSR
jgi:hypothetical protein